jgi:hypothetical protein
MGHLRQLAGGQARVVLQGPQKQAVGFIGDLLHKSFSKSSSKTNLVDFLNIED